MAVKFYISENDRRREKGFKYPSERENSLRIARIIWRQYREAEALYLVVFNVDKPPADMIVITNYGVGVADLKDVSGSIAGHEDDAWTLKPYEGGMVRMKAGSHLNPFVQVSKYRKQIKQELQNMARFLPENLTWLARGDFDTQASLVITGGNYDIEGLDIDPAKKGSWFSVRDSSNISDWVYSLSFKGYRQRDPYELDNNQVETLAMLGFRTREWVEFEEMLTNEDPYAFLWLCDKNDDIQSRYTLTDKRISVGRDISVDIRVEDPSKIISNHHSTIQCKIEGVFIKDEGSTNGTYVNGLRIVDNHLLENGDKVVLGPCDQETGNSSVDGSYFVYTTDDEPRGSTKLWSRSTK